MSMDETASWQSPLSSDDFDDAIEPTTEPSAGSGVWDAEFTDLTDPPAGNLFTAEIENVNASDWDVDATLIWGDDDGSGLADDTGGGIAFDFPL
jgi:hypothetical protein